MVAALSETPTERHLAAAAAAEAAGDMTGAIGHCRAALALSPAEPGALNGLGLLLLYSGDAPQAIDLAASAAHWQPRSTSIPMRCRR